MKKWYGLLIAVVNVLLYLVIIALWVSIPEVLALNIPVTIFNLVLTLIILYSYKESLHIYYASQQFKKFSETLVFIFLISCLLGLVNYWAYKHPFQKDFSAYKMNSLTDQSKGILKNIKGELKFKLFSRKQESMAWMVLLEFYRIDKNDIIIEKVDIDVRPDLVADYQVTNGSTLVLEYNGKRQYVTERDELNITNGLIKVSRPSDPVVYFATGHGEADITSKETEGMKLIFEATRNSAIEIRPIQLISATEIPFDAKALIIWGPRLKFLESELKTIQRFLDRKGNLFIALDPDLNGVLVPELRELLKKYGLLVNNNIVVDKKSFVNGSNGSIPLIETYNADHPITKKFKGETFFPLVSSVEDFSPLLLGNHPNKDGKVTLLFSTTSAFPYSWGESSIKEFMNQDLVFTKGIDRPGPLSLAASFESDRNKIIAFGNSSFVLNAYSKFGANYTLFLNSLSWLVDEDRLISFNLPIIQNEPIFISSPQMGIVFYFSVLFSPLILFGLSIYMYRRKRDK